MLASEALAMVALALLCGAVLALLFKELAAVAFDPVFGAAAGLPVTRLDGVIALLSLATVVVGLRVVGLVLIVALLVIPPAARPLLERPAAGRVGVSAAIGAASAFLGAAVSAVAPDVPDRRHDRGRRAGALRSARCWGRREASSGAPAASAPSSRDAGVTLFLQIDFPALLAASLAALACSLVGNFLVLTRRAMVSDA
jgi:ABC-type Mn2+/Zn2+ transport system permease subunit